MVERQQLLLEELREEVNYLHGRLQRKCDRASRIIEFNLLSMTVLVGLVGIGNSFEISLSFVSACLVLGISSLAALYCVIVGSFDSKPSTFPPSKPTESHADGEATEATSWFDERVAVQGSRVEDFEARNRVLGKALAFAGTTGPVGVILMASFALDTVDVIQRGPLGSKNVVLITILGITLLLYLAVKTIRLTRPGKDESVVDTSIVSP